MRTRSPAEISRKQTFSVEQRCLFSLRTPARYLLFFSNFAEHRERSRNAFGLPMSLNMLSESPGGFDFTGKDCIAWMREVGFRDARVEHLLGPESMVIRIK
jgi:hypothetical protein